MSQRLLEKLRKLGLSAEESNTPKASTTPANKQKRVTFRIYFPMPPFDGIHFNALKAGHGAYNFTGLLLGVGGKQLQRIKQESNSRVEVVNSHGNLNGSHPDPIDETLHALVTADNMVKLQRAVDLVVQVLSPTNASFESFQVEAGGSMRLLVTQPSRGKAAASKAKQSKPSSSNRPTSLDGSCSSCSTKGMPPSPALTPVTPAATGSRHGSMFAPSSSVSNSCSSSRAPTPSPSTNSSASRGAGQTQHSSASTPVCSGESGSKDTDSYLESFQLPPAALPAVQKLPFTTEEWPALPSSQETSSSKQNSTGASKPGLFVLGADDDSQAGCTSRNQASSQDGSSLGSGSDSSHTACHHEAGRLAPAGSVQQGSQHAAALAGATAPIPAPVEAGSISANGESRAVSVVVTDDAAAEHALLSPLTPQAQQYQQQQQSGMIGASAQASLPAGSMDAAGSSSAFMPGMGMDSRCCGSAPESFRQLPFSQEPCDLDLLLLRQRAGLVSQVCLHCDGAGQLPASSSMCACAGVPPAAALQIPYMGGGSGLMGFSAGYPAVSAAGVGSCDSYRLPAGFSASGADFGGQHGLQGRHGHNAELLCQGYQRQAQECNMQMVAAAAASVNISSDGGGVHSFSGGQFYGQAQESLMPGSCWDATQCAANCAAVAAAASSAFGAPSLPGVALEGRAWDSAASSFTSSGFMAQAKSIW